MCDKLLLLQYNSFLFIAMRQNKLKSHNSVLSKSFVIANILLLIEKDKTIWFERNIFPYLTKSQKSNEIEI